VDDSIDCEVLAWVEAGESEAEAAAEAARKSLDLKSTELARVIRALAQTDQYPP
jgi:hypothetical protein